jgi:hypothetical protein
MSRYAAQTEVSSEKSRVEIERTLTRYGADGFMYGWQGAQALIAFRMNGRQIKFILPMPDREADEFATYLRGSVRYQREPAAAAKLWEQACRQRWRALALVVKAKLEAVECGISEFDDEFMANIVMPDGSMIGQWARPQIRDMYLNGKMPPLLPAPGPGS